MKTQFSTKWKSSVQPRKQRKFRANAPLHTRSTFLHVHLAKDLRTKHATRAIRVRTGDEVQVMRGQYAGRVGKVERVSIMHTRVFVTGIDSQRRDGSRKLHPLQPSNLLITKLTDDKRRFPVTDKPAPKAKVAKPVKAAPAATKAPANKPASAPAAKAKVKA